MKQAEKRKKGGNLRRGLPFHRVPPNCSVATQTNTQKSTTTQLPVREMSLGVLCDGV